MKDMHSRVAAIVVALLLVWVAGCSSSEDVRHYDVSHPCPEGETRVHRISPDLNPKIIEGIKIAVDEWGAIIGPKHPQRVIVSSEASEENIACVTSWLYNDDLPAQAMAVTEAGRVHFTRSALPEGIMLQLPLHEMGHVLGLGDSKIKYSVMWKFIGPGQPITCQDKKDVCVQQGCEALCEEPQLIPNNPATGPCVVWQVQVDSAFPEDWGGPIAHALDSWNSALNGSFNHVIVTRSTPQPYDNPLGCVLAIQADASLMQEEGASGFADTTLVNDVTGQKFGHIRLIPEEKAPGGAYSLVLHELGHFFGLSHSTIESSIMHVPLPIPGCVTDKDATDACMSWGCVARLGTCKTL